MTAPTTLILWSHALAAFLFAGVAAWRLRDAGTALPRRTFVVALGATALWALAVAGIDARDVVIRIAEAVRNLAWLGFMYALMRGDRGSAGHRAVAMLYGVLASLVLVSAGLSVLGEAIRSRAPGDVVSQLASVHMLLRMMVAVGALVLVHHLYGAASSRRRGGIRLAVLALAALWGVDLLLYAAAYATGGVPGVLVAGRGIVFALAAPVFAVAVQRGGDWTLQLSRTVAWQAVSFAGILLYAAVMLVATSVIAGVAGADARLYQTAFVFGSTAAGLTILSSPWVRAWAKVKVAKHFFRHRYDYRAEWIRFTDTLGKPEGAAPLAERIVKAVADLTDSPAGLLLVPDGPGPGTGLGVGTGWNWDAASGGAGPSLAARLSASSRIVDLDAVRAGTAGPDEAACVPRWMLDAGAWVLVPLAHLGRLQGGIVLARPPIDRALDWEDFDLLRIAGRQVASYLAEARAQEALAEAQRFDEFNRRFAFILHDIKNLVSQLTLVARNAERHADNPAFRADMVATLQDSSGRMNDLLARLSQHHRARAEDCRAVDPMPLVRKLAAASRAHPVVVRGAPGRCVAGLHVLADPARLEQLLGHLVQNAIEASAPGDPVTIAVSESEGGVVLSVIDRGCGMTPAFLRDQLFKPFASSKPGGFGIGAFEVKQLAEAMGGTVAVESHTGAGTTFRVTLPVARALAPVSAAHAVALGQAA